MEDDVVKSQKEVEQLRQRLHESEQLRQEMQEDYRKAVAECMNKENENVELVQKLASAIKEIHQLQVSNQTHDELIKDLNSLLVNGEYADCHVQIGNTGDKIALHRAILATRSQYFRNIINEPPPPPTANRKGQAQSVALSVINLENMSKDNANQILEYIYCGKCRTISDDTSAKELYDLSIQLGFLSLKDIVVDYYVNKLSRENCLHIASKTLYIQNDSEKYREYVKNFIITECTDLIDPNGTSEQWRRLKLENPSFAVELLENRIQKDEKRYRKFNNLQNIHEESVIGKSYPADVSIVDTELSRSTIGNNTINNGYNNNNNNKTATPRRSIIK
jgi:hypothetical protein